MKKILFVSLLLFGSLSSSHAGLINGSFEDPGAGFKTVNAGETYGGWTAAGPSDIEFVLQTGFLSDTAYDGDYWIDLTGVSSPSGIYQDISTVSGATYDLSFALAGNFGSGSQIMKMKVLWDGNDQGTFEHDTTGHGIGNMGWSVYTLSLTAVDSLTRLQFQGLTGVSAAGAALDGVTLVETSSVPEPATLALLAIGLTGLGFRAKRKKLD